MLLRKAIIKDITSIHNILNHFAKEDLLLPRSLSELYDHLRDYFVQEDEDHNKSIIGVCGLRICWEDLAEIKSLAVIKDWQGQGLGAQLVLRCLDEGRSLGIKKVFTLTYSPVFFNNLGFKEIAKETLPHKVWAECLNCPKFPKCDEIALMLDL